ncbi:hypothetical protein HG263_21765 [Pseudoalteromonas sp. JBTF-M23]|uniref:Uncharacterized protein n=1 Tax=Pseudoalteromonas caenipelagi TaxID=2726988 RepID=A0A849VI90_9GAMM|nr:hypothetical protein [Pseudoalteromonas caenipelagi]NOU53132.1 hypothetical protein [Pseudoalteromonas caenipelagi]
MSDLSVTDLIDLKVQQQEELASKQNTLLQLGQIQAFNFMGKLVTVTELKLAQQIKETKSYKGLTLQDDNGKVVTVTTWEQCCKHILQTDCQNLDNRLRNLQQFGEEFFEAAQKMKLGYRDLRALRQLPEDEQALVIESEAVETGDKDAVKELIDELKAKHKKEKDKLATELDATERMLKASRNTASEKEDKIVQLTADLESKKFSADKWKGEAKSFFEALAKTQNQIREGFNQLLVLSEQLETVQIDDKTYDAAKSAFYADSKILLTQLAGVWNEIHRTYGDLDDARPSGEWLAEMGFEGTEVIE